MTTELREISYYFRGIIELNKELVKRNLLKSSENILKRIESRIDDFDVYLNVDKLIKYFILRNIPFQTEIFESEIGKIKKYMEENLIEDGDIISDTRKAFSIICTHF